MLIVIVQGETFHTGNYVFVKGDNDDAPDAAVKGWVAKILEIRSGDSGDSLNIYVRVYWMYRPEDLPKGRQPYHGENELIASNEMAIIEAQTIQSHANVEYWDEKVETGAPPNVDLYWRQTLDVSKAPPKLSV